MLTSASIIAGPLGYRLLSLEVFADLVIPEGLKPLSGGTFIGTVPFVNEGGYPLDTLVGTGLGKRLVLDLSRLSLDTLVTPSKEFFIRTGFPDRLRSTANWKIQVRGRVKKAAVLSLSELMRDEAPAGTHLIECAGNPRVGRFGLISTARWTGIPIKTVLRRVNMQPQATRIIVSGFDEHSRPHRGSAPGASWSFTFEQLELAGAFLATAMNGLPLSKDHGYPVRFVMPGWYGCSCIKWVNLIVIADDTAPATGHMKEYAGRTHQDGISQLAKDFEPATVDLAAMPVRVEAWRVDDSLLYRIVGIMWGGEQTTRALVIRFNPDTPYVPVRDYDHQSNATWTVWSYIWRPQKPGRYEIRLQVDDPSIRTRRLDAGHYTRIVEVETV
ncbi:MAG: molybdopterin-dependent oxidoreductase [Acidiferrobacterales bacterium]